MKDSDKSLTTEEVPSPVPVQPGLFEYPPPKGFPPALLGNRCKTCGRKFFPKRYLCPHCFVGGQMEELKLDRRGIIYACTVIHFPPPVGIKAPYACGYVDMPDHGIRIFTLFAGGDPLSFTPGQEVELILESLREDEQGRKIIGYKFKPIS